MWLFEARLQKLSKTARRTLDSADPVISAAVIYEWGMLHEAGKANVPPSAMLAALTRSIGLTVCGLPFRDVVEQAIAEGWTRDPFDRLIVANARAAGAPLVTADERILARYSRAIW